jgi:hypothetical protein
MSAQRSMLDYLESETTAHSVVERVYNLQVTEFVTDVAEDEDPTPRPPSGSAKALHRTRPPPAADMPSLN